MFIEIYSECFVDFALRNHCVTKQPTYHLAPQPVFRRQMITAHRRDPALVYCFFPSCKFAEILRIGILKSADRRDSHSMQVCARFCRIALKISMQRAFRLGYSKLVSRFGEVIHPDIEVSRFNKLQRSEERRVGKECRSRWSPY